MALDLTTHRIYLPTAKFFTFIGQGSKQLEMDSKTGAASTPAR